MIPSLLIAVASAVAASTGGVEKCSKDGQHCLYVVDSVTSYDGYWIDGSFRKCEDAKIPEEPAIEVTVQEGTCLSPSQFATAVVVRKRNKNYVTLEFLIGPKKLIGEKFDVPAKEFNLIAPDGNRQFFSFDKDQSSKLNQALVVQKGVTVPGRDTSVNPF